MSVARRFDFVIGPFLIIDLEKISAFPICVKCCCWPDQSSHPLCHRRISVQSQLPAITGGLDFGRGLFFVVLAPFHPVGRFSLNKAECSKLLRLPSPTSHQGSHERRPTYGRAKQNVAHYRGLFESVTAE